MAIVRNVRAVALCLITSSLLAFVGCGGGGGDDDDDGGNAGVGGQRNSGSGLPARLPDDAAECASATGSDGCFFAECCSELLACSENADCAKTFACYVSCPSADSNCFASCAGSALTNGGQDFAAAFGCTAASATRCGGSEPGSSGGSGGTSATGGTGNQGGSSNVGPLGSATDELGWNLVVSDDPLTAELEPDDDRAVSQQVTLDGGTLTATSANGTVFELKIPEGALYAPTLITLTPLRSLSVAGLDGDAHGVQIEPDGLAMMGSPTLEITPPDGDEWSVEQLLPLAITGEDDVVSLALIDAESESVRLPLTHFSSYAVLFSQKGINATLSQADIRSRFAGNVEERLQSAAAERLAAARLREFLGESSSAEDLDFSKLAAEFEEHVVKPRVAQAGTSCAAGKLAMQTVLGLSRQTQLLGLDYVVEYSFIELIPTVAEVCIREEYEICRDEHIITRMLPTLLGYMRQAALLGLGMEIEGVTIPPTWLIQAEDYVRKCLQFELQFDSNVTYVDGSPGTSMNETVAARVPIAYQSSLVVGSEDLPPGAAAVGALILGQGQPLESTAYSVGTDETCRTIDEENAESGELLVSFMGYIPAESTEEDPGVSPRLADVGLSLALSPNLSSYVFTQRNEEESGCGDVSSNGEEVLSWSSTLGSAFLTVGADNGDGENGAWYSDWDIAEGDIIATKDMTINDGDDDNSTRGPVRMVLFHTPE